MTFIYTFNIIYNNDRDSSEVGVGIWLGNSSIGTIQNNTITNNSIPIVIKTGATSTIDNNQFLDNIWGIETYSASNLLITNNLFDNIDLGCQ